MFPKAFLSMVVKRQDCEVMGLSVIKLQWTSEFLTLAQRSPGFYVSAVQVF